MKTVYPDEKNFVLNENSVENKSCINRESKSDELTIKLYSCHDINLKFLVVVTPPSIYHHQRFHNDPFGYLQIQIFQNSQFWYLMTD